MLILRNSVFLNWLSLDVLSSVASCLKPKPEHGIDSLLRLFSNFLNVRWHFDGTLSIVLHLRGLLLVFRLHLLAVRRNRIKVNYLLPYVDVLLNSLLR